MPAPIDDAYDYNRDRQVNVQDELIVRANPTTFLTVQHLVDLTGGEGEAGGWRPEARTGEEPGRSEIHDLAFSELLEDWAQEDGL